ncbi:MULTISPECIES: hypothetical protein [unclassified Streptomyces]|uniref:hypothetical protein n=1 Tax=unclassified Streptomyces TaxID=2593676 RepID=UPI00109EA9EF|nr:hypothetical protein [Streptomyces sp. A1136]THA58297.1 hypothetical protein E6R62_03780 [Streptomyces sp. A1136]
MTSMTSPADAADFRPTHVVPQDGLPAWEAPDVSRPTVALDPFLPVQLLSRQGEWGEVLCSNGWSAWVDGRLLVAVPRPPPTGGRPLARSEDPAPLLARSADVLERYRRAADQLAAGRVDTEGFRRGTRGLRAGVVIDGESVWLYDEAAGRWLYAEGGRAATYAVVAGPGSEAGPRPPDESESGAPAEVGAPASDGSAPDGAGSDEARPHETGPGGAEPDDVGHESTLVVEIPENGDR